MGVCFIKFIDWNSEFRWNCLSRSWKCQKIREKRLQDDPIPGILSFSEKVDFLATEAANLLSSGESENDINEIF